MGLHWIVGAVMLIQQAFSPDSLTVTREGTNLVELKRSEYVFPLSGAPLINDMKLKSLMNNLHTQVYRAPVNAFLDGRGAIVKEQSGYMFDRQAFTDRFFRFMVEGNLTTLEAPRRVIYPKVDSELLTSIREKMIGYYTTYYNSRNKNRSQNIALAAKAINNQYLFPGEKFSFNEVVGERSVAKGYSRAKIIVKGEVAEGIGGGICQISSTLFNAVDRAGLHITQRYSHSRRVPYVPPGRDATVSWYGPDFVFENKYNQPIMIRAFAQHGQVTILIYSSGEINDKPRNVPSASKRLPEEIPADRDVNGKDSR